MGTELFLLISTECSTARALHQRVPSPLPKAGQMARQQQTAKATMLLLPRVTSEDHSFQKPPSAKPVQHKTEDTYSRLGQGRVSLCSAMLPSGQADVMSAQGLLHALTAACKEHRRWQGHSLYPKYPKAPRARHSAALATGRAKTKEQGNPGEGTFYS